MPRTLPFIRLLAWIAAAHVLSGVPAAAAQVPEAVSREGLVVGRVTGGGSPLEGARVWVRAAFPRDAGAGLPGGVTTGADGRFRLALPAGTWVLRVAAVGHAPREVRATVAGTAVVLDVALEPRVTEIDPVVVTGTLSEARVSESPVKVDVVSSRFLARNLTNNLMEAMQRLTGVSQQVDCGVCFTNSIRINGMEGPYTAVLVDGTPVMSALATAYGLNGINPALLEQVEVVKGPSSTLYGSEAMGGVINVITKDPRFAPALSLTGYVTGHGETSLDVAAAPGARGLRGLVSASLARNDRFVDGNGDGFTDLPLVERAAAFAKAVVGTPGRSPLELSAQLYREDRFGGTRGWTAAHRGSDSVYGEYIETRRIALIGAVRPWLDRPLRLDLAVSTHDQDSWYGVTRFAAEQATAFVQGSWAPTLGRHRPVVGATFRWQRYDDASPATAEPDRRTIVGLFAQDEWAAGPAISLLGGLRLDHHAAHGVIASPRASAKWEPGWRTTLRLNAATGFRIVNLFTEDHAALSGARRVVVAEALDPERSWTLTASLRHVAGVGAAPVTLDLDAFMTRFGNRISPDYDTDPDLIVYRNLDGHAVTRGLSAALTLPAGVLPVSARIGATTQQVFSVEAGLRKDLAFAPTFKGEYTVSWAAGDERVVLDFTGRVVGPMALPERSGRVARSPWFSEHDLQGTVRVGRNAFLIVGVKNVLDYVQRDPILHPEDPFGPDFDTFNVWGPTRGRRVMLGLQVNQPR